MREKIEQVIKELENSIKRKESMIRDVKNEQSKMMGTGMIIGMERAITKLNAIIAEDRTAEVEETRCRG